MIKRFLIAFVLLAVVCGGLVYFNIFRNQAIENFFATMQQPALPVQTVTAEPASWQPGIEAIGTVSAVRGVDLAVEAGGVVREVNFTSNDAIEEGTVLVQIDDQIEQSNLIAARANLTLAEQTLARAQQLRTRGVSAESSLEEAEANAQAAQSEIASLNATLSQKALEAPFSGTIGIPQVEAGQYVTTGTVVATLQDLSRMRVDFSVPEQQRSQLQIGQTIRVGTENGSFDYSGTIVGIEPRIDPATRLVSIRAEVENTEEALNPGQFARVRVELPEESDVIALPQTAIVSSLYGDFVYVVREASEEQEQAAEQAAEQAEEMPEAAAAAPAPAEDAGPTMEARQVFVTTGRRNGSLVEIAEGLSAGDIVVSAGQNRLSNGALVTIDESESPLNRGNPQTAEQVAQ
ncbi:efflux RND transporter periplasmic adaptor subunit [Georhizobium profundi]|uniref:Efflux RND transporter periplasmic adaptor subunit n=1 Tax=Georhizobium profundi TaxID=2341112 RepID=A0A3Q8XNY5_9HYPH|nr:efflux RND transporter periplasmic adaptor subunit [Georhizobium profundi]AZN71815.1 efflux RND transporter periplasmic adaptor subunit [Georhizobium profundi]